MRTLVDTSKIQTKQDGISLLYLRQGDLLKKACFKSEHWQQEESIWPILPRSIVLKSLMFTPSVLVRSGDGSKKEFSSLIVGFVGL